jgi:hypothetical protein
MKPGLNDELCGQAWTEQDVSGLQDELAKRLGYLIVDWSRPSLREGERIAMKIHRETCIERKWPLVVVYIGLHYCTVQIDTDPMQRPKEERQGGLTVEEQADIDTLMAPYRREWADSPVLRRYGRVFRTATRTWSLRGSLSWLVEILCLLLNAHRVLSRLARLA